MTTGPTAEQTMTGEQLGRWTEVLSALAGLIPDGAAQVVIDGERHTTTIADRLAERLVSTGRSCERLTDPGTRPTDRRHRTVTVAAGPHHRAHPPTQGWDTVIWLRTSVTSRTDGAPTKPDAEVGVDVVRTDPGEQARSGAGRTGRGERAGMGAERTEPGEQTGVSAERAEHGEQAAVDVERTEPGEEAGVSVGRMESGVGVVPEPGEHAGVGIGRVVRRDGDPEAGADIVIDLYDEGWPVIRHVAARLAGRSAWYIAESRAFFAARAETWDVKFGDDMPAYAAAVAEAGIEAGGTALDAGCGTGRALPSLRAAVGPRGTVIGLDITPQMLTTARSKGRAEHATLLLADARHLPIADAHADAVFAAGLIPHLPDVTAGLTELARVTRAGGRLILFHPSGRAALAARHGRELRPDEPLAETRLGVLLSAAGWRLSKYDDPPHRFFALAIRL